jgi:hypothetical protein
MKRLWQFFVLAVCCTPVFAGLADDGFLTTGEYIGSVTWRSYDPPLIVDGGGHMKFPLGTTVA